jgi:hypothetical protein
MDMSGINMFRIGARSCCRTKPCERVLAAIHVAIQ